MKADSSGEKPETGESSRTLGVRAGYDVKIGEAGAVDYGYGGMSVSPLPYENIPRSLLPKSFGGRDPKNEVFEVDTRDLPRELAYREDPAKYETHGFIEPAFRMSFENYRDAIYETSVLWKRVQQ